MSWKHQRHIYALCNDYCDWFAVYKLAIMHHKCVCMCVMSLFVSALSFSCGGACVTVIICLFCLYVKLKPIYDFFPLSYFYFLVIIIKKSAVINGIKW